MNCSTDTKDDHFHLIHLVEAINRTKEMPQFCYNNNIYNGDNFLDSCKISCQFVSTSSSTLIYTSMSFWTFSLLRYVGTVTHSIGNSVSDATCLEMLDEKDNKKYGSQRLWAEIGLGSSALLAGHFINLNSANSVLPLLIMIITFCLLDVLTIIKWLKLPIR